MRHFIFALSLIIFNSLNGQSIQSLYENLEKQKDYKNWGQANTIIDSLLGIDQNNNYWLIEKVKISLELGYTNTALNNMQAAIKNGYRNLEVLQRLKAYPNLKDNSSYHSIIQDLETDLLKFKVPSNNQELIIDIPPLMECYVIMLYLGNPSHTLINKNKNLSYFNRIDNHFEVYKNDPLVLQLKQNYPGKEWINNLRAHHNLRTLFAYNDLNIENLTKVPVELDKNLAQLVKTFAEKSGFMSFYKQNKYFYQSVKDIIRTNYAFGSNIISFFNQNFEQKINRFNVYFSPIYGGWQHGPKIKIGDYIESFYFGGIVFNNKTEFYYPDLSLYFTLITEFDHTPINAITNKHFSELEKLNSKLPILYDTEKVAYGNIHETINEYLTWGFALQYFYEKTPQEYEKLHKRIVNWMEQRKFVRFEEFMNFYEKKYINNRKNYPMFEDFLPSVINWIQDI